MSTEKTVSTGSTSSTELVILNQLPDLKQSYDLAKQTSEKAVAATKAMLSELESIPTHEQVVKCQAYKERAACLQKDYKEIRLSHTRKLDGVKALLMEPEKSYENILASIQPYIDARAKEDRRIELEKEALKRKEQEAKQELESVGRMVMEAESRYKHQWIDKMNAQFKGLLTHESPLSLGLDVVSFVDKIKYPAIEVLIDKPQVKEHLQSELEIQLKQMRKRLIDSTSAMIVNYHEQWKRTQSQALDNKEAAKAHMEQAEKLAKEASTAQAAKIAEQEGHRKAAELFAQIGSEEESSGQSIKVKVKQIIEIQTHEGLSRLIVWYLANGGKALSLDKLLGQKPQTWINAIVSEANKSGEYLEVPGIIWKEEVKGV